MVIAAGVLEWQVEDGEEMSRRWKAKDGEIVEDGKEMIRSWKAKDEEQCKTKTTKLDKI